MYIGISGMYKPFYGLPCVSTFIASINYFANTAFHDKSIQMDEEGRERGRIGDVERILEEKLERLEEYWRKNEIYLEETGGIIKYIGGILYAE